MLLPWATVPPLGWPHPHAQWSDLFLGLALVTWTPRLVGARRATAWTAAVVGYGAAAFLSWTASDRALTSLVHVAGMASLVASALLVADLATDDARRLWIVRAAAVGALSAAVLGLMGAALYFAGVPTPLIGSAGDLVPGAYPRIQGPSLHPNLLASVCLFGSAMIPVSGWPRGVRRGAQAVLVAAVLLTFSRTIVTFALALFLGSRRATRRSAIAALVFAAVVVVLPTVVNLRVQPLRPWSIAVDPGPSPRAQALVSATRTFLAHPFTGIGPGRPPGTSEGVPFDAHCTIVNVAATLGLPGLIALAAVVVTLVRADPPRTGDPLWALLAALAVDSLATDVEDFRHVWIALGLVGSRDRSLAPSSGP